MSRLSLVLSMIVVTGCTSTEPEAVDDLGAGPQGDPAGCLEVTGTSHPIAIQHLHDEKLVQTLGLVSLEVERDGAASKYDGAALATIVGQTAEGASLANHHFAFGAGTLRTQNDVVVLTPTDDECIFDVAAEVNFFDGTGEFAGYSGKGSGSGQIDFCGAPGEVALTATICK
jgi:hypothetical protein